MSRPVFPPTLQWALSSFLKSSTMGWGRPLATAHANKWLQALKSPLALMPLKVMQLRFRIACNDACRTIGCLPVTALPRAATNVACVAHGLCAYGLCPSHTIKAICTNRAVTSHDLSAWTAPYRFTFKLPSHSMWRPSVLANTASSLWSPDSASFPVIMIDWADKGTDVCSIQLIQAPMRTLKLNPFD